MLKVLLMGAWDQKKIGAHFECVGFEWLRLPLYSFSILRVVFYSGLI
jgi:hypothetical protein